MQNEHKTLLLIGAQHPAWSANPDDKLVRIFNEIIAEAREAVGAIGVDEDAKADWCASEAEAIMPTGTTIRTHSMIIKGMITTSRAANYLLSRSQWFAIEPLPDDQWELTVKREVPLPIAFDGVVLK